MVSNKVMQLFQYLITEVIPSYRRHINMELRIFEIQDDLNVT
jgi:hypothetical protein